jgi:hypothetical protein
MEFGFAGGDQGDLSFHTFEARYNGSQFAVFDSDDPAIALNASTASFASALEGTD